MQELTKQREMLYTVELVCHIPNLASNRNGINEFSDFALATNSPPALRYIAKLRRAHERLVLRYIPVGFRTFQFTRSNDLLVRTTCRGFTHIVQQHLSAYRIFVRNAISLLNLYPLQLPQIICSSWAYILRKNKSTHSQLSEFNARELKISHLFCHITTRSIETSLEIFKNFRTDPAEESVSGSSTARFSLLEIARFSAHCKCKRAVFATTRRIALLLLSVHPFNNIVRNV